MIRFETEENINYIKQENIKLLECPKDDNLLGVLEMNCGTTYSLKAPTLYKILAQMQIGVN